ncbi:MAG: hypothetical protein J5988_04440 [Eubacterium sp.]|nr:hypothetical protein [Eubacterium sp.]
MKVLYLHIGTAKTGTTAIQEFCRNNDKLLEEQGFCYPQAVHVLYTTESRNAHFLVCKKEPDKRNEIFKEGMNKVRELFETYDNIILSDETIWWASSYLIPDLFEKIKAEAERGDFAVKVVVYLRRQDSFADSHWNQQVKKDGITRTCEEHLKYMMNERPLMLDYYQKLEEIAACFGRENILVRRFEQGKFEGGSIYTDFAKTIGMAWREDFQLPEKTVNERLKRNTHEIKRVLNGIPGLEIDEKRFFEKVLIDCSKDIVEKEKYSMFSPEEIRNILDRYHDGNEKIAQQYLKDGKELFDDTVEELPKWEKDNQEMYDDILHFVTRSMAEMHREMRGEMYREIRKENEAHHKELNELKEKMKHPIRTVYKRVVKK